MKVYQNKAKSSDLVWLMSTDEGEPLPFAVHEDSTLRFLVPADDEGPGMVYAMSEPPKGRTPWPGLVALVGKKVVACPRSGWIREPNWLDRQPEQARRVAGSLMEAARCRAAGDVVLSDQALRTAADLAPGWINAKYWQALLGACRNELGGAANYAMLPDGETEKTETGE